MTIRRYDSGNFNSPFEQIMRRITAYADSFAEQAQKYTPADGSLAEQYNRENGTPLSARDLTWSYAAFVSMAERRAGEYPPSKSRYQTQATPSVCLLLTCTCVGWETRRAAPLPATCSAGSTLGVYEPATAAGAPNVTTGCQINVVFDVNATTYFGENIYVSSSSSHILHTLRFNLHFDTEIPILASPNLSPPPHHC